MKSATSTVIFCCKKWNYSLLSAKTSGNLRQTGLLQDRFDSCVAKRATFLFDSFCSCVVNQVVYLCCQLYRTLSNPRPVSRISFGNFPRASERESANLPRLSRFFSLLRAWLLTIPTKWRVALKAISVLYIREYHLTETAPSPSSDCRFILDVPQLSWPICHAIWRYRSWEVRDGSTRKSAGKG